MTAFAFKPFHEMTDEDYSAIGLKCGLEVHQQLLTNRKLFCRCPSGRYSDEYDAEVLRHMRPTLSELGEYDPTALMEKKTKKNVYYRIKQDTVCTYELDDTPPFFPDDNAIDIAIELSLLLGLNMVGEIHIARKQYLDGSIPTGFQRTAILGVGGSIPYRDRRIGITQLSIEEDSCREVSDIGHDRVLLTDRLGMPLIEVVTDPEMHSPREMVEVCEIVRMLCRSTGRVRTGYGAARQDVNVSVRGGLRIEIKGVPRISRIPLLVYNEARRQCALLRIRDLLNERGVTQNTLQSTFFDVTRTLKKTRYLPIREAVAAGRRVKCVILPGFAGLLNHPTQEHTTFAKEFSDRVRVIACLMTLPNIAHSDTAAELLSVGDWKDIAKRTKSGPNDATVLVWGSEEDTRTACGEISIRAREATIGVPADTRQAFKDGTNGFERVLPGPERMYPDTDLPPIAITTERLEAIAARLPEPVWDRRERYSKLGLPGDVTDRLCMSARAQLFGRLVDGLGVDPVFASVVLVRHMKALEREGLVTETVTDDELFAVFEAYREDRLAREGVVALVRWLAATPRSVGGDHVAAGMAIVSGDGIDDAMIEAEVRSAILRTGGLHFQSPERETNFLIGHIRRALGGRVGGRRVAILVRRELDAARQARG